MQRSLTSDDVGDDGAICSDRAPGTIRSGGRGAEFAARNKPLEHPFEAMLLELGIKHR